MLQRGDSIIIGLSGGADSVAMLHALINLQDELGISQIFAAHINHGLRGEDAFSDENFCRSLCETLQVPLQVYQADVHGIAKREALTIEEAGRKLRYKYLQDAATFFCKTKVKIATGHHQNDNAETVIMNLARGAGLRGLCGIPPVNGDIIRPIIDVSRAEIESYITKNNLQYVEDASNFSQDYARNRIRHTVLPAIEAALNTNAVQTIANNTTWLRADEDLLNDMAQQAYENCCQNPFPQESGFAVFLPTGCSETAKQSPSVESKRACTHVSYRPISWQIKDLAAMPVPIARRVIRHTISQISPTKLSNITSLHIQSIIDLLQKKTGAEVNLPGLCAYKTSTHIVLAQPDSIKKFGCYPLKLNHPQYIPELDMTISVTLTIPSPDKNQILHCTKSFDYGKVEGTLILRARQPGDTIYLGFTKKIQNYFTDKKIPKQERDSIPILACGSDVLWVMDKHHPTSTKYRPAQEARSRFVQANAMAFCRQTTLLEHDNNICWVSLWRNADA